MRLEDITPADDPALLRAAADYLFSRGVPFGFGVISHYLDPFGTYNGGVPQDIRLREAPEIGVGRVRPARIGRATPPTSRCRRVTLSRVSHRLGKCVFVASFETFFSCRPSATSCGRQQLIVAD